MRTLTTAIMVLIFTSLFSQTTTIEGYIFEKGNRGYLSDVSVTVENIDTEEILGKSKSDTDGFFKIEVPINSKVRLYASKDMFDIKKLETEIGEDKSFVKLEMGREPGYTFEVTLAEKRSSPNTTVDAITGTRIEVYNNTTHEPVMDLKDHDTPTFQLNLKKGNHYTLLIRKNGFLSKRMEAMVDVEGCILCFEGVGRVGPSVTDNLTENNKFGVLLANVELERIFQGKTMEIQNLYYELGKWALTSSARVELNKVITLMKDNPNLTLELGSHTDSRATSEFNMDLSNKRAQTAVNYLKQKGEISDKRIVSRGYGETLLLNECADGVKCSEEEHAINRRTELKIVGITDMKEVKSLAQMKKEEQLEREILELMNQEQIRAKDEDELKKIIESKSEMNNDEPVFEDTEIEADEVVKVVKEEVKDEPVFEDTEIEVDEVVVKKEVKDEPVFEDTEIEADEVVEVVEEIVEDKHGRVEDSDAGIKREIEALKEMKKATQKENRDEPVFEDTEIEMDEVVVKKEVKDEPVFEDTEIEVDEVIESKSVDTITPVSDGIKVIVFQSETRLKKDHFVYLRHRNVEEYDNGRGTIYYMVGGFSNEPEAFKFMNSFIIPDKMYKGPFVANFTNGIMAVVNQ